MAVNETRLAGGAVATKHQLLEFIKTLQLLRAGPTSSEGFISKQAADQALVALEDALGIANGKLVAQSVQTTTARLRTPLSASQSAAVAAILDEWEEFAAAMKVGGEGLAIRPAWTIACYSTPIELFIAETVRDLHANSSFGHRLKLHILGDERNPRTIFHDDEITHLDYAVLSNYTTKKLGADNPKLYTWRLYIVTDDAHPWRQDRKTTVTLKELGDYTMQHREVPLFTSLPNHASGRLLHNALNGYPRGGIRRGSQVHTAYAPARFQLGRKGLGVAIVPTDSSPFRGEKNPTWPMLTDDDGKLLEGCYTVGWRRAGSELRRKDEGGPRQADHLPLLMALWKSAREAFKNDPHGVTIGDIPT